MAEAGIKSMKLYSHLERVSNELIAAGSDPDGPLTVDELSPFDNLHYHGTEAVAHAIQALNLTAGVHVAEVGSGLGGPARFLADRSGCHVTALELQADMNEFAEGLTRSCGLNDLIKHQCGDVLDGPLESNAYDGVVSWLACYHIPDQELLYARIAHALKPGGRIYIEDLTSRGTFTDDEAEIFATKLYGQATQSPAAYRATLEQAGFTDIAIDDLSTSWADFTRTRLNAYRADKDRHLRVQGEETVAAIDEFYAAVDELFQGGNLGGARIVARKA